MIRGLWMSWVIQNTFQIQIPSTFCVYMCASLSLLSCMQTASVRGGPCKCDQRKKIIPVWKILSFKICWKFFHKNVIFLLIFLSLSYWLLISSYHPTPLIGCLVTQSCLTLCDTMDCSFPGSSVHGIFQARIPEWGAISFSRGYFQPRDWTHISCYFNVNSLTDVILFFSLVVDFSSSWSLKSESTHHLVYWSFQFLRCL